MHVHQSHSAAIVQSQNVDLFKHVIRSYDLRACPTRFTSPSICIHTPHNTTQSVNSNVNVNHVLSVSESSSSSFLNLPSSLSVTHPLAARFLNQHMSSMNMNVNNSDSVNNAIELNNDSDSESSNVIDSFFGIEHAAVNNMNDASLNMNANTNMNAALILPIATLSNAACANNDNVHINNSAILTST